MHTGFWAQVSQYAWTSTRMLWKELDMALTYMNISPPEISGSYMFIQGQSLERKV